MAEAAQQDDVQIDMPPPSGDGQDDFVTNLSKIYQRLKYSKKLKTAMKQVEQDLLKLLNVRLFTIYQCVDKGKEILASIKGGGPQ